MDEVSVYWFELDTAQRAAAAAPYARVSVSRLPVATRTLNALLRANSAMTVADVLCAGPEIQQVYGLGRRGLAELHTQMTAILASNSTLLPEQEPDEHTESVLPSPSLFDDLATALHTQPLSYLHLSARTHGCLERNGYTTLGSLVIGDTQALLKFPGLGRGGVQEVQSRLALLRAYLQPEGVDWVGFWNALGVILAGTELANTASPQTVLCALPQIVKLILEQTGKDRRWEVIQHRYGLGGVTRLTLEELGAAFQLTRERVRQIQQAAMEIVRAALLTGQHSKTPVRVIPAVVTVIQQIVNLLRDHAEWGCTTQALQAVLRQELGLREETLNINFKFLADLAELDKLNFRSSRQENLWITTRANLPPHTEHLLQLIDRLLTEKEARPWTAVEILAAINRKLKPAERISLEQVRQLLAVCTTVEAVDAERYQGKLEFLETRFLQIERILQEHGEPLHIREIVRQLNHRLALSDQCMVLASTLTNYLSTSDRLVPIGRSGKWGLASWNITTEPILELMKRYLLRRNAPATTEEIVAYVQNLRPASRESITIYLTTDAAFVQVAPGMWGLAEWKEAKPYLAWIRRKVGAYLVELFEKRRTRRMPYADVVQALMEAANVSEEQIRRMLTRIPIIQVTTRLPAGEQVVELIPDYQSWLETPYRQRKPTLGEQVKAAAQEELAQAPDHTLPLRELIQRLETRFQRPYHTIYGYVSRMETIEKFTTPGARGLMCRLRPNVPDDADA